MFLLSIRLSFMYMYKSRWVNIEVCLLHSSCWMVTHVFWSIWDNCSWHAISNVMLVRERCGSGCNNNLFEYGLMISTITQRLALRLSHRSEKMHSMLSLCDVVGIRTNKKTKRTLLHLTLKRRMWAHGFPGLQAEHINTLGATPTHRWMKKFFVFFCEWQQQQLDKLSCVIQGLSHCEKICFLCQMLGRGEYLMKLFTTVTVWDTTGFVTLVKYSL